MVSSGRRRRVVRAAAERCGSRVAPLGARDELQREGERVQLVQVVDAVIAEHRGEEAVALVDAHALVAKGRAGGGVRPR